MADPNRIVKVTLKADVKQYIRGMRRASRATRRFNSALWSEDLYRDVLTARALGYHVYMGEAKPDFRKFTLPPNPFLYLGPLVLVRELILDDKGMATRTKRGARKQRYRVRWVPTTPA